MVTIADFLRRGEIDRRPRLRRFAPEVAALETRELQTVNGTLTKVFVHPAVLKPGSSGQVQSVHIYGTISSNHAQTPIGLFFVTDEYRTFEPAGAITLRPAGGKTYGKTVWYDYVYSFNINFPTKRSTNTADGRHYDLFVGARDGDGTGGLTVEVLVPKTYHAPTTVTVARQKK